MKNEKLEMKREEWEYFRLYRQAPFKKKYLERLEADKITQLMEKFKKS